MFPHRYFPARYFAQRYFPQTAGEPEEPAVAGFGVEDWRRPRGGGKPDRTVYDIVGETVYREEEPARTPAPAKAPSPVPAVAEPVQPPPPPPPPPLPMPEIDISLVIEAAAAARAMLEIARMNAAIEAMIPYFTPPSPESRRQSVEMAIRNMLPERFR